MARRYDQRTTTFSPEGRLHQVEYAIEAISHAGSVIGIQAKDGVVLAGEKKETTKLVDPGKRGEKVYKIDDHVIVAVAGLTSDANALVNRARINAQHYFSRYGENEPVEQLVVSLCDYKQQYTQFGGLRPFGVSFMFAGWDRHFGFQLYQSDPAGNYTGWKATAIGNNYSSAVPMLKQDWKEDMALDEAVHLAAKVLLKTTESSSLTSDKCEFAVLTVKDGKVSHRMLTNDEILAESKKLEQEQQQTTTTTTTS
ncbi:unnamed protein product [Vitrella brassicaformis CCMP3155]|uniref:Proteasome subunit alpha type n=2 Tax=Vitrella brassicaformis TaxID=1169539 RepID=A0A0G4EZC2_VITBC|nr:unnamed protein product [Vitrella brassicaformis CCMP3155]|mmetsp:Transcript_47223/g.117868  ORF Transcript_47223/g.117868 Transcript_47223/m.117868 type:complete len:254 (+) Transcript_47223:71-832(+)|eukprot:CEM04132.1 unnamed protein product [Vitrella brassicaformis CCMP3155]